MGTKIPTRLRGLTAELRLTEGKLGLDGCRWETWRSHTSLVDGTDSEVIGGILRESGDQESSLGYWLFVDLHPFISGLVPLLDDVARDL